VLESGIVEEANARGKASGYADVGTVLWNEEVRERMANTKAPRVKQPLDPESESWRTLPWRKLEQHVYRIQKRIFRAESRGETRTVHKLQKLLMKSRAARLIAVRRVTQDNQGKKTAGIDGVKSVPPKRRLEMAECIHPKQWKSIKAQPVRRIYIPKPGKAEKRPLGIPVMETRAHQTLVKLALEPAWEAKFEVNSYGFRPGRSCHDAIAAIYIQINKGEKYVLDADISGCFDTIRHSALIHKLNTYPAVKRVIQAWLTAGTLTGEDFTPTEKGTPQGGCISPLLMNIALHGMEAFLAEAFTRKEKQPRLIRYADDLVVFHPTEAGVKKAQALLTGWLANMGLELKPSKTKITHTLREYQGNLGFEFLGVTIQQFPVGKTHSGKVGNKAGDLLGFKTIITPSKEAIRRHLEETRKIIKKHARARQDKLIRALNPVVHGWTNYYRTVVAMETFAYCRSVLFHQLESWAKRRHPNKGVHWTLNKYWHTEEGEGWKFQTQEGKKLREHTQTHIQRHIKVKGTASPYDGNLLYWSTRLRNHPIVAGRLGRVLQKQQGKCKWCGLLFKDADLIELDHITPKSQGGKDDIGNLAALHLHCHDQRHAQHPQRSGVNDNDQGAEELDEMETLMSSSEDE
jgi:RNA-directed DNA polymerase